MQSHNKQKIWEVIQSQYSAREEKMNRFFQSLFSSLFSLINDTNMTERWGRAGNQRRFRDMQMKNSDESEWKSEGYKGSLKVNVAPFPSLLLSAQILPPCASIMLLEMNSPRPVPV